MAVAHALARLIGVRGTDGSTIATASNPLDVRNADSTMNRILNKRLEDTEEIRYDVPTTLTNGNIYLGVATDGTSTAAASWDVVRIYFDGNDNPTRARLRTGIAWDSRTTGW